MDSKPVSPTEPIAADNLPAYQPPAVITYTDEQLLDQLGPAQARPSYTQPG